MAHEHVLRGMVKYLTGISNDRILDLRIPNAAPFVFEFDKDITPIKNYYLDDTSTEVVDSQKQESKETIFHIPKEMTQQQLI